MSNSRFGLRTRGGQISNIIVTPLTVDFSVDDTTPDTNQTVTFTDLTVGATQWLWDFGDGNLSTLQNPTHFYKTTGSFTVTLCASDGTNEGREVKTNYITVSLEAELTTNLLASFNAGNYNNVSGAAQAWFENISGADVTNGTPANRPVIIPNGLNGFPTLQGNGVNLQLGNSGAGIAYTDGTVYIVFKRGRIHTGNEAMTSSATNQLSKLIYNTSNELNYFPRNTTLSRGVSYGNNVGQWLIMAVVFNGASSTIKFMQSAPAPIGNIGSTASTGLYLFMSQGGAWFQGELAEVKIYNAAHNATTQTQVIQRLQAKFNLYG
jgi:PKD repeat protein